MIVQENIFCDFLIDSDYLLIILECLKKDYRQGDLRIADIMAEKAFNMGWFLKTDFEDLLYYMDSRLDHHRLDIMSLSGMLEISWEKVCFKSRGNHNDAVWFEAIKFDQATLLLILLERIGFQINAKTSVDLLIPQLKNKTKQLINETEAVILKYHLVQHKVQIYLSINDQIEGELQILETLITKQKYKIVSFGLLGELKRLKIIPSKYRRPITTSIVECEDCGLQWEKGNPSSSYNHRREHKKRMQYLNPKPLPKMLKEIEEGLEFELVNHLSPVWKHNQMLLRARAFKQELHFDFLQWHYRKRSCNSDVEGYLFTSQQGSILGACCFRFKKVSDNYRWILDWVWVCPQERRSGILESRWANFKAKYGDFFVTPPISESMQEFLLKNNKQI
ncbi:hypothetical protein [Chryseobacterium binzhouense]|uniref:hypothetical protein n=1 Tax=Chryseobacterium binzhouense TaxID=2593646 RepID=UPI00289A7B8E|nr:hypothetical protein [Chryseobacterium binzhouense]